MNKDFHGRLFKFQHKFWEFDVHWEEPNTWTDYFSFRMVINRKTDHAGFSLSFCCMRFFLHFQIYDHRHWNYDAGRWNRYGRTDTELDDWL